jgi:hypothetical protein
MANSVGREVTKRDAVLLETDVSEERGQKK